MTPEEIGIKITKALKARTLDMVLSGRATMTIDYRTARDRVLHYRHSYGLRCSPKTIHNSTIQRAVSKYCPEVSSDDIVRYCRWVWEREEKS
jgi:hypothetical protein